jgi:hypothetical protein
MRLIDAILDTSAALETQNSPARFGKNRINFEKCANSVLREHEYWIKKSCCAPLAKVLDDSQSLNLAASAAIAICACAFTSGGMLKT